MGRVIRRIEPSVLKVPVKKRVAAYARVSSGKAAMRHSLSAQISYYSELIQKHHGWEYAGVYADEAITGTKENRAEFQRLLNDCRNGKVDMIMTKSISRFARNTVTMLEAVRELKSLNVDVFFEKENIHSMSGDGELMLSILASFAQEESLSVSENCKWRIRDKFKKGIPNNATIWGYKLNDEVFEIIPKQADIVRMIYSDYLSGMGKGAIAKKLNAMNIKTRKNNAWNENAIHKILINEKYVGDLILQKTFVKDYIEKRSSINEGQLPKYFVENCHPAIIDRDTFLKVQQEMEKRRIEPKSKTTTTRPFTGKIKCLKCGKTYRWKMSNSGTKYEKPVWICNTFSKHGKKACSSQQIPDEILRTITTEVLGLVEFDEIVFEEKIKEIQVSGPYKLIYIFDNEKNVQKEWHHKSRSETWREKLCVRQEQ